jgi:hypothetical protein
MSAASQPPIEPAPAEEETRQLPAFGSGLEFRPQGKLGASKSPAAKTEAAARANGGSVGRLLENEEDDVEEVDNMQDDEPVSCFPCLKLLQMCEFRHTCPYRASVIMVHSGTAWCISCAVCTQALQSLLNRPCLHSALLLTTCNSQGHKRAAAAFFKLSRLQTIDLQQCSMVSHCAG